MANPKHVEIAKRGSKAITEWRTHKLNTELALGGADLGGAMLRQADLRDADLRGANLSDADLSEAKLSEAKLSGANLGGANLGGADLSGANLRDAEFSGADLFEANLSQADLRGANLYAANLRDADLSGANLSNAELSGANLSDADLSDSNLTGAHCSRTSFGMTNLSEAKGLDAIEHDGSSTIGVDTILASKNKIPPEFLRGCGYDPKVQAILLGDREALEDAAYAAAAGLGGLTLQSCFISYASKSRAFANRLQKGLNDAGVDYWYAPENAVWGRKLRDQFRTEIRRRDRLILICSKDSLSDSDWVQFEIGEAAAEEKRREKGESEGVVPLLYPVMIDDALTDWDSHLRPRLLEVLAGDFRGATKGKAFDERLPKLIEGLKASGAIR